MIRRFATNVMYGNAKHIVVFVVWIVAMSWLVVAKLSPSWRLGEPPDYHASLPAGDGVAAPVCWRLFWNERPIGYAATQAQRSQGEGETRSVVKIDGLSMKDVLSDLLGAASALFESLTEGSDAIQVEMLVASRTAYARDPQTGQDRLKTFQTHVDFAGSPDTIVVHGKAEPNERMRVRVFSFAQSQSRPLVSGDPPQKFSRPPIVDESFRLPQSSTVGGEFSPHSELKNLRLGQSWTIPVHRPFPPSSPVQIMHATVERERYMNWEGQPQKTLVVVYRTDSGGAVRGPTGRMWVREDGVVLKQEIRLGKLRFSFVRLPDQDCGDRSNLLNEPSFLARLKESPIHGDEAN